MVKEFTQKHTIGARIAGAGLTLAGVVTAGGSTYMMYVNQKQKQAWEAKLAQAEKELSQSEEELIKLRDSLE